MQCQLVGLPCCGERAGVGRKPAFRGPADVLGHLYVADRNPWRRLVTCSHGRDCRCGPTGHNMHGYVRGRRPRELFALGARSQHAVGHRTCACQLSEASCLGRAVNNTEQRVTAAVRFIKYVVATTWHEVLCSRRADAARRDHGAFGPAAAAPGLTGSGARGQLQLQLRRPFKVQAMALIARQRLPRRALPLPLALPRGWPWSLRSESVA